jgi:hypothetical protein
VSSVCHYILVECAVSIRRILPKQMVEAFHSFPERKKAADILQEQTYLPLLRQRCTTAILVTT